MLILAVDTSHKNGTVSLARADDRSFTNLETANVDGGTFSAQLVPVIAGILARQNHNKRDIDIFAAATGPGSFTGLRIGLAAVKAMAEVLAKPIVPVSMLEAMAASYPHDHNQALFAIMDAGRSEVYVGEYGRANKEEHSEYLCSRPELISRLASANPAPMVLAFDPLFADALTSSDRKVEFIAYPGSEAVARIGYAKFLAGKSITVDELEANYVRRDEHLFTRQ